MAKIYRVDACYDAKKLDDYREWKEFWVHAVVYAESENEALTVATPERCKGLDPLKDPEIQCIGKTSLDKSGIELRTYSLSM